MAITIKQLPGPKGLPILGMVTKLDLPQLHNQIEEWADQFGDVFRLRLPISDQMVITRPSLIQKICIERPDTFIRARKMDNILREGGVHGVFNAEGEDWKVHRRVVAQGLDVKHQQQFYPTMMEKVEKLYKKWCKNAEEGQAFDIQKDILRFTVDVTTSLAFGYDINTIEQEGSVIQDHTEKIFPVIFKRINSPVPWHRLYKSKTDREFDEALREIFLLIDDFIEFAKNRLANNPELKEKPENLIEAILVESEKEGTFSNKEIKGNLLTLLIAGEDTTANSLIWMIYLLTQHPEKQIGIREELDNILGTTPWLDEYKLNSELKYIESVAFETLRFKPVAPIILHEAIQDVELEGIHFKKGQMILTQYRHAALKDEYFTSAKEFMPERWLKETRCPVHITEAYTPFGAGPRFCPGRNLALLEIKAITSMLFKNFEIEMITPHDKIEEIMAFTMMSGEYLVKLKFRPNIQT